MRLGDERCEMWKERIFFSSRLISSGLSIRIRKQRVKVERERERESNRERVREGLEGEMDGTRLSTL